MFYYSSLKATEAFQLLYSLTSPDTQAPLYNISDKHLSQ
jgi:hypothetical protein